MASQILSPVDHVVEPNARTAIDQLGIVMTNAGIGATSAGLTAHSGGGQGSAVALTLGMNQVTTVAGSGDSVVLPVSAAGMAVSVVNATATNPMNVFPAASETINALSGGTAISVAAGKTILFLCPVAGKWYSILTA